MMLALNVLLFWLVISVVSGVLLGRAIARCNPPRVVAAGIG